MTRFVLFFVALLGLSACETPTPTATSGGTCPTQEACFFAEILAAEFQGNIGTNFGGDVILRRVQADGAVVIVDLGIPVRPSDLAPAEREELKTLFRTSFLYGFCVLPSGDLENGYEPFFEVGGSFRIRSFGPGNDQLNDFIINTCRGVG